MPASKRPKKKYRPRPANPMGGMALVHLQTREELGADRVRDLLLATEASRDAIERGQGAEQDLVHLAVCSNVALLLAEQGMGRNMLGEIQAAQREILAMHDRFYAGEGLALSGPGIRAVRQLLDIHTAQVEHPECTLGVLRTAIVDVHARMMAGHVLNSDSAVGKGLVAAP